MSNDERVKELDKRIGIRLSSSSRLINNKNIKPNRAALLKLAKEIRKTIEDYSVETPAHSKSS